MDLDLAKDRGSEGDFMRWITLMASSTLEARTANPFDTASVAVSLVGGTAFKECSSRSWQAEAQGAKALR